MGFAQAFLTTSERDAAIAAYIKRGAKVKKDGAMGLIVVRTRWESGSYSKAYSGKAGR